MPMPLHQPFDLPNLRKPAISGKAKRLQNLKPGQGKPKGAVARISRDLREGLIDSAVQYGSNGRGEGGLVGFFLHLARNFPRTHASLLCKLLPLQIGGGLGISTTVAINVVSIPAGFNSDGSPQSSPIIEPTPQLPISAEDLRRAALSRLSRLELLRLAEVTDADDS